MSHNHTIVLIIMSQNPTIVLTAEGFLFQLKLDEDVLTFFSN